MRRKTPYQTKHDSSVPSFWSRTSVLASLGKRQWVPRLDSFKEREEYDSWNPLLRTIHFVSSALTFSKNPLFLMAHKKKDFMGRQDPTWERFLGYSNGHAHTHAHTHAHRARVHDSWANFNWHQRGSAQSPLHAGAEALLTNSEDCSTNELVSAHLPFRFPGTSYVCE